MPVPSGLSLHIRYVSCDNVDEALENEIDNGDVLKLGTTKDYLCGMYTTTAYFICSILKRKKTKPSTSNSKSVSEP